MKAFEWEPTRAAGLSRLAAFVPAAGRAYAANRNSDLGPEDRSNVSALSPWIRRRMITEDEVIAAVLAHHSPVAAEKFIQEVVWRTYWKGWLEMRPDMLWRFDSERIALKEQLMQDRGLARRFDAAIDGRTGIDCFDVWADELRTHGWLHNHTRMWFASIWIFTLGLPWQLGADHFYKHLLDADPASNTLSWRWVAGLHTAGKHYVARAENIARNTGGRFDPGNRLNERAEPLSEDAPLLEIMPLLIGDTVREVTVGLLITEEDLHPESWGLSAEVKGIGVLPSAFVGDADGPARRFSDGALTDATTRAAAHFSAATTQVDTINAVAWAQSLGVREVVTGHAPVGMIAKQMDEIAQALSANGIRLTRLQRDWDRSAWPHARAGFFKLKTRIPHLIAGLG